MPEVTVVIAARNAGRTIDAALASVFAQTLQLDAEVLVVDDGSTDDTVARVRQFGPRVRLMTSAQSGAAAVWNSGLAAASGEVVMLLQADDLWMPRKTQRQMEYLRRFPEAGLVHGDVLCSPSPTTALLDSADAVPIAASGALPAPDGPGVPVHPPAVSTVAIRREALARAGLLDPALDAERALHDLWNRLAAVCRVGYQEVPVAVLRTRQPDEPLRPTAVRARNLLHDTRYRRARSAVTSLLHAADDLVTGSRRPYRILFEAASPMSVAVFGPVLRQLERDPRLQFWFTSCDRSWDPAAIFGAAGIHQRVVTADAVRWAKFDAYVNTDFWDMTWLPRRTRRVHFFHGVAGKYGLDAPVRIAPVVATFDRLMFPSRDRLRRYAEAGLIDADGPQAALVGYPKVDCLVDGSLDRLATLARAGLTADRPTALYAPTWSPYSSLNTVGHDVIAALGRLGINVVVKLHDRSYDAATRGSGGVDWKQQLASVCARHGARLVQEADASPWLHAADLLVTDHSSVGFEFMLLDRPLVVIHSPDLISNARVTPEKAAMLRNAAFVVEHRSTIGSTVREAFDRPHEHSRQRRAITDELFYCPGSATARAVQCMYDLLALPQPTTVEATPPAASLPALAPFARSL